jgi:hypothetical protein
VVKLGCSIQRERKRERERERRLLRSAERLNARWRREQRELETDKRGKREKLERKEGNRRVREDR